MTRILMGALALILLKVSPVEGRQPIGQLRCAGTACGVVMYDRANPGHRHAHRRHYAARGRAVRHPYVRHTHRQISEQAPAGFGRVCTKEGHCSSVAGYLVGKFQGLIHDFEEMGYNVGAIGCLSRGHMPHSLHHSGRACDFFSQDRRGHLPMPHPSDAIMNEVAERHGLTSGASWCDNDRGHFDTSGYNGCHGRHYVARNHRVRRRLAFN